MCKDHFEIKEKYLDQYVLLLLTMDDKGIYQNQYYAVGHKWTE